MLTKDFHPSQLSYVIESRRTAKYGNIATFALGVSACVVCLLPSHWSLKLSNMAIASGLFLTSYKLEKLQKWGEDYRHTTNHESIKGYAQHLNSSFAPPRKEIAIADVAQPVKFADVKQALSKPHCMLLGSTGDGKSTLAKHLAANCTAYTIVIDPHAAPEDWGNLPVFGAGRKYEQIAQIMQVTLELLQVRFDARDQGVKQFEPIVIICDEYPAIIASAIAGKIASSWMKLISREARKVSIRLVVLTQSPEVKAIGLEGEGSVRDNFCFIRLGEFALDHAKSLKDESIKSAIENADRPAMLGNLPCAIPTLSDRIAMPVLAMPSDYQMLIADKQIAPNLEPIDRPKNQQSALTAPALTTSAPSTANQQSASLSAPLTAIVDYAKRKDEFVSARQIQSGIAIFKQSKADEIREYFKYLATLGYGVTRGADDNLEFSAN
jgi:energy-coupling factor transporter ATP-binding protein EcfA2